MWFALFCLLVVVSGNQTLTCDECKTLVTKSSELLSLIYAFNPREINACHELVKLKYPPEKICQKLEYCPRKWWSY